MTCDLLSLGAGSLQVFPKVREKQRDCSLNTSVKDTGLALPAPVGRSRRTSSTQATRDHNSSQKVIYFTVGKSEDRDWGSTQIIHRDHLLGLNTENPLLLQRMLCQPRSLLAPPAEELSCLVSVLRSRGQALQQQARSAAGAQC